MAFFEQLGVGRETTFASGAHRLVPAGMPVGQAFMMSDQPDQINVGGQGETFGENITKGPRKIAGAAVVVVAIATAVGWVYNHVKLNVGTTIKDGQATTEISSISPVIARTPMFSHVQGGVGHAEESKVTQFAPSWGNVVGSYVMDWEVDTTGIVVENATDANGKPTILVTRRDKDGQRIGFDMSTVEVKPRGAQYCDLKENYKRKDEDCGGDPNDPAYQGWYGFQADPGKPEHSLVGQYAEMAAVAMAVDTECFNRNFLQPNNIDAADLFTAAARKMLSKAVDGHPIPPEAVYVEFAPGKRNFIPTKPYLDTLGALIKKYDLIKNTAYVDGTPVDNNHCLSGVDPDPINRTLSSVALLTDSLQPGTIITEVDPVTSRVKVITAPLSVVAMRGNLPLFSNNGSQKI